MDGNGTPTPIFILYFFAVKKCAISPSTLVIAIPIIIESIPPLTVLNAAKSFPLIKLSNKSLFKAKADSAYVNDVKTVDTNENPYLVWKQNMAV